VSARVLVVDDDEHILRAMATSLKRAGFDVTTANDGTPAVALTESFDIVIADFNMTSELTGADVVRHFKQTQASIVCFVLSGEDDPDTRETCMAAGATDVLLKPVSPIELRRRLADALGAA
jgi:CheY-like chemotaxis protein